MCYYDIDLRNVIRIYVWYYYKFIIMLRTLDERVKFIKVLKSMHEDYPSLLAIYNSRQ